MSGCGLFFFTCFFFLFRIGGGGLWECVLISCSCAGGLLVETTAWEGVFDSKAEKEETQQ